MPMKPTLALVIALISLAAWAKPAAWYWWTSKLNGSWVCQQTSPGHGWYRAGGPYRNGRCNDFPSQ